MRDAVMYGNALRVFKIPLRRRMPTKAEVYVSALDELPEGQRRLITVANKSIGVFNTGSQIVAVLNICPHAFAPVCLRQARVARPCPASPASLSGGGKTKSCAAPGTAGNSTCIAGQCLTDRQQAQALPRHHT